MPDDPALKDALRTLGFPEDLLPEAITALPTPDVARRWVDILGRRAFGKKLISAVPASGFDPEGYLRWSETGLAERDALTLPSKLAGPGWDSMTIGDGNQQDFPPTNWEIEKIVERGLRQSECTAAKSLGRTKFMTGKVIYGIGCYAVDTE